jgi:hypothetical protein
MGFTLTVRQGPAGQHHLEVEGDAVLLGQLVGSLFNLPVAPALAAPPLRQTAPPNGKGAAGHANGKHGHRVVAGLVCKFCESTFEGRRERKYCSRRCQQMVNLLHKAPLPELKASAPAA